MSCILHRVCLLCCALLALFCAKSTQAQLHADFTSSAPSGCAPLIVNFTDASAGSPSTWKWDLGNGTISTLRNPAASYFNPGTYNVKLVVRGAGGTDSILRQQYITVYQKPVTNFSAVDTSGCFPYAVTFTDHSSPGSGTISGYAWDFGDGTTSSETSPSHVYMNAGTFSVSLKVTNSNGCVTSFTRSKYIVITNGVKASFKNTNAATCDITPRISFSNTSAGPGNLSFEWNFGDGAVSAEKDPVHTYTIPGTYTVSLTVISPQGCRDTIIKPNLVTFGPRSSSFVLPDSVCAGSEFAMTNTSEPAPASMQWNFGDGSTSVAAAPVKSYPSAGIYHVRLINDFGGCRDTVSRDIVVKQKPVAAFSSSAVRSCQVPFPVVFKTSSTAGSRYLWDFGDGTTSTAAEPTHIYIKTGTYDVRLILINSLGCPDTVVKKQYIIIEEPVLKVDGFPRTGCLPLMVRPTASVITSDVVTGYNWDFGDGSTSTSANPAYTYTKPGTYTVTLTITTSTGCKQTVTLPAAVKVGAKPEAGFRLRPNDVCASQAVQFTDTSKPSIDQWLWNFGDGGTSNVQHPSYTYSDTGYFSVTLVVWNNTCADTVSLKNIVHIRPPIAAFTVGNECEQPFRKTFRDQSVGAKTWYWSFGDGQSSTLPDPVHNYASGGSYPVTLVVTNGSCSHTTKKTVVVVKEETMIRPDRGTVCRDGTINFNSGTMNAANIGSWTWDFGDGTPTSATVANASHVFSKVGRYTVRLTTRDVLGCENTASLPVIVYGPAAAFSNAAISACLGAGPVSFMDQSTTDGTNHIVKYKWSYGDGITDSLTGAPFRHNYNATGSYLVSLTVTDAAGCSSSVLHEQPVVISKPVVGFYSPDTASCIDKPVSFFNTSTGNELKYAWHLGDGSTSTAINPVGAYTATGLYDVQLVATDKYGCTDSLAKPRYINISLPVAGFSMSDSIGACPPLRVSFTNNALNFRSVTWDFGDGNTSVLPDPVHTYTFPGTYIARQTVTGPGGCQDVFTRTIVVKGPTGTFGYTPTIGCNPLTVGFKADTKNGTSFLWDFTDGNTSFTNDASVMHTYNTAGDYIPRLILTDAAGCNVPIEGKDTIHVVGVQVNFIQDISTVCDKGLVTFTNQTVSNDYIISWLWNFGDGKTSTVQHPSHYYTATGNYRVSLIAVSSSGCPDSMIVNAAVKVAQRPLISISGNNEACIPANATFRADVSRGDVTSLKWQWDMRNGNTAAVQHPSAQQYLNAATYTVTAIVTDTNSCRDTASHVFIARPLPPVNAGVNAVYCLGTPVQLRASGAGSYTWLNGAGLSCTDCDAPLAAPSNQTMYIVEGKNQFGCVARDSIRVRVRRPFTVTASPDDTLCFGTPSALLAAGAELYSWQPATGLSSASVANPRANPTATTTYMVTGADTDGCFTDTASIRIKVYPIPVVALGDDITLAAGGSTKLKAVASADVTSYRWSPAFQISCIDCPEPVVNPRKTMDYTVRVANEGGCQAQDDVKVFVTCNNGNLFIPNTFSPDGNGMNDRFYPRGTGIYKIRTFRVFNRWGQVVYEAQNFNVNDAAFGWDGTFKGKAVSADVFIYTCEVVCQNDEIIQYKGDVSLIR